ncbi:hypothetical protein MMC10_005698 [Thelotrema lepadinum]|nr:hypothetical protein [Thelotrema lepadinum]
MPPLFATTILLVAAGPALAINLWTSDYSGNLSSLSFTGCEGAYTLQKTHSAVTCGAAPSWLTLDPTSSTLYCVDESTTKNGSLWAYSMDSLGALTAKAANISTTPGPVNSGLYGGSKQNSFLALAGYGSAAIQTFALPLKGNDQPLQTIAFQGSGPNAAQKASHPHQVILDPTNNYLLSPDLGADAVHVFTIDQAHGKLTQCDDLKLSPGSGPRHLAWLVGQPDTMYLAEELANKVSSWTIQYPSAAGGCGLNFTHVQDVTPYKDGKAPDGSTPSEIRTKGNTLYVSTRNDSSFGAGMDSIASFSVSPGNANFTLEGTSNAYGTGPRTFDISPDGNFIAIGDQLSGDVHIVTRNPSTGVLGAVAASINVVEKTNSTGLGLSSVIFGTQ